MLIFVLRCCWRLRLQTFITIKLIEFFKKQNLFAFVKKEHVCVESFCVFVCLIAVLCQLYHLKALKPQLSHFRKTKISILFTRGRKCIHLFVPRLYHINHSTMLSRYLCVLRYSIFNSSLCLDSSAMGNTV